MKSETLLLGNTIKKVGATCKKYHLLDPGDQILIGLSGGKDSLFLLEALSAINKKLPIKIKISACHIHIKDVGYKVDPGFLQSFCAKLEIPLIIDEISADLNADPKKAPCFVCSWYRRKRLFEITHQCKFNKLALGHHSDDAIETLLMNMVYHGSISSLPAKLSMFGGRLLLIRPLIERTNQELLNIAAVQNYPLPACECPYGNKTKRTEIGNIIHNLEQLNPQARKNIFRSMSDIYNEYLPDGLER
jgi:tRNA 2-thiocytidine biosynthesis protein TtcA